MEVLQTTNYDQFQMVMSNREVDERHVLRLTKSIQEKNLLCINPIIVDEDMSVIDGQHRLEAAKALNVPIHYVVSSNVKKGDISRINSNQKNWKVIDYINYFTIEGVPQYQELSRLICRFPAFSPTAILRLVHADTGRQNVKEGVINIDNIAQAADILEYCNRLLNKGGSKYAFVLQRNFTLAIRRCFNTEGFDKEVLLSKIDQMPRSLVPCINERQYCEMIEEIYNYRSSKNIIRLR